MTTPTYPFDADRLKGGGGTTSNFFMTPSFELGPGMLYVGPKENFKAILKNFR